MIDSECAPICKTNVAGSIPGQVPAQPTPPTANTALKVSSTLTGKFWADDVPAARIQTLADRVLVGGAVVQNGARVPPAYTWVHNEANGFLTYFDTRSQMEVLQTIGGVGIASAVRTSDNPGNPATIANAPIAYAALAKNDVTDAVAANRRSAWSYYGVACRAADGGAGAIAGSVQTAEFEIANQGSVIDVNPYIGATSTTGVTYAQILGSGGEYAQSGLPVNAATAALHIAGVGASFRKGINFSANAIDGTNGTIGTGIAMSLAKGHELHWYYSGGAGADSFAIRSDNDVSTAATKIVATNTGLRFYDFLENTVFRILPSPLVAGDTSMYLVASNIKPGLGNPIIQVAGAGTNGSMLLKGMGTGGVALQDGAGANKVQVNTTGISFFGAAPVAKPNITGSRGGNAALASLLTQLATLGLITDGTTV